MTTKLATAIVEAQAQLLATEMAGAKLNIYSGTQPAGANQGVSMDATLLASLTFGDPAFSSITGGIMTSNPLTGGVAESAGTATWFRILKADNVTPIMDGNVSETAGNLVLTTTEISVGVTIEVTTFTHTVIKNYTPA